MSQASFRLRSFLIGISVASITWGASIYLYLSLASHSNNTLPTGDGDKSQSLPYVPLRGISNRANSLKHFVPPVQGSTVETKTDGQWKLKFKKIIDDGTMYKNSPSLLSDLKSKVKILNGFGPKLDLVAPGSNSKRDPVHIELESVGLIKTIEEKKERERGMKQHAFNALISSRLSSRRNIPDTRHDR